MFMFFFFCIIFLNCKIILNNFLSYHLILKQHRWEGLRSTRSARASQRAGSPSLSCAGVLEPALPCLPQRFVQKNI